MTLMKNLVRKWENLSSGTKDWRWSTMSHHYFSQTSCRYDIISLHDGIKVGVGEGSDFLTRAVLLPVLRDTPASRKVSQFLSFKTNKCHMSAKREPGISWCTWQGVLRRKEHATDEKWQGVNKCNRQIQEMLQSTFCRFRPRPHEDDCKRKR